MVCGTHSIHIYPENPEADQPHRIISTLKVLKISLPCKSI
uniref:Uncharacterized protein n=1 Tax=Anopheles dirus TaxID=7168 RepID=A0A182NY96_9DIPT